MFGFKPHAITASPSGPMARSISLPIAIWSHMINSSKPSLDNITRSIILIPFCSIYLFVCGPVP